MTIKDRLLVLLEETNESQSELARNLRVAPSTVSMWLSGENTPRDTTLASIANHFGVYYEWLEKGIGPKHPNQSDSDVELLTRVMEGQNENKKRLIRLIAEMPDELLYKMVEYLESRQR